jgi:23S rRNA (uracil1939-C5)-methyltransferase
VTIDGIGAGGAGVGRLPDGRAIFVQRTTAGDDAEVSVEVEHKRWARGRLVDITHEGPHRRTPPCPLYMRCGGCTLQHLEYGAQLSAKAHIVAETLRRIGGLEIDVPPIERSPHEFHYRNRASFTLLRAGGRVIAGYHVLENPGRILDVDERCLLLEPSLTAAWRALRDSWGPQAALLPAAPRLRLTLRAAAGGCSLLIEGGQGRGQPEALLAAVPALRSIWSRRDSADRSRRIAGDAALEEQWGDESISMRGGVFVQVNRAMAAQLEAHVLERAGAVRGKNVVDAYCGIGAYTSRLMHAGAHVTGIEIDADATAAAAARLPDARFLVGPVEKLLPQVLPADIVIANPPRAGMHHDACNALHARPPKQLLYVSCDPATLARDVARLGPAFSVASIRCFDMFPQTAHVETVLELTCATS